MSRIVIRSKTIVSLIFVMFLVGCATVSKMQGAPYHEGTSRVFRADPEDVVQAVRQAILRTDRLEFIESRQVDQQSWIVIAKEGMSAFSWGTLVRVFIEKASDTETTVYLLTKRRLATNITAKGDYSSEILGYIPLELHRRAVLRE